MARATATNPAGVTKLRELSDIRDMHPSISASRAFEARGR